MVHAVVGAQFGDEGKGKMVDYFAVRADMVIRYQGGSNAGHTIVNEHGKFGLHLVPSGIFNPSTVCVLGAGVVIHPMRLVKELNELRQAGIATDGLVISERAHIVLPYHIWQDQFEEQARARKVGTTLQGVGPAYQDKAGRYGLQMGELLDVERFRQRLRAAYDAKLTRLPGLAAFATSFENVFAELMKAREVLAPYITDTIPIVQEAVQSNKDVLLEGQLGIMRDLDWGVYPYVTSSSPISGGISAGAGLPPTVIDRITGITKAYTTAVGAGPFPTGLDDEVGAYLQEKGQEFGVTTGRTRSCGWLDIPTLKYGAWINGYTELALMKLDVLSGLPEVKICTHYKLDGQTYDLPRLAHEMEQVQPVYETLPGWTEDLADCRTMEDLPPAARKFVERVEALVGVPIRYVSVGPDRKQTIVR
ncbi:adenylosuccinate synthase [Alicyclobacillus cycloheptanicus]|uniref:Adenylosuccinate synthetase n=1 Tax=Alicyclobacillus cycloheptanicus TaxID=1457 RepID=A0ABT9XHD1_9BACL|nr:adenylosuccinate synthase [Alicyclobacillus cycloheptanicus]MDQ0189151.1 adenylosuccinate synthase [Alicyclobacillus cycloheptanicus]WDM00344.1 adenylosuccinate synthase [Alicyclobacillus cycloheptanicus]